MSTEAHSASVPEKVADPANPYVNGNPPAETATLTEGTGVLPKDETTLGAAPTHTATTQVNSTPAQNNYGQPNQGQFQNQNQNYNQNQNQNQGYNQGYNNQGYNTQPNSDDAIYYLIAFFFPCLGPAMKYGCDERVLWAAVLTMFFWIPGMLYAFLVISNPEKDPFKPADGYKMGYHQHQNQNQYNNQYNNNNQNQYQNPNQQYNSAV